MTIHARWNEKIERYEAHYADEDWHSTDGDEWNDENGESVISSAFNAATIELHGGPRSGQKVS